MTIPILSAIFYFLFTMAMARYNKGPIKGPLCVALRGADDKGYAILL